MVSAKGVERGCTGGVAAAGSNQGTPRGTLSVLSAAKMVVVFLGGLWMLLSGSAQHHHQHA
jgi:hypothetical protein